MEDRAMARIAKWLEGDGFYQLYIGTPITIVIYQEDGIFCMQVNGRLEKQLESRELNAAQLEVEETIKSWASALNQNDPVECRSDASS